jgi:hypothetical protein
MPKVWIKKLQRENPVLAEMCHRQCALDVAIELSCSEEDVHKVIIGDGRDVKDAERITGLYWLLMKAIMLEHDTQVLVGKKRKQGVGSTLRQLFSEPSNSEDHSKSESASQSPAPSPE